jgi:hypothetical protein
MKTFNAADETQLAELAKKELRGRDRELEDLREILATKSGRRFVWRLLNASELFSIAEVMNASIYALEGKRKLGKLLFLDVMEAAPEAYLLMMKESKE